MKKRRVICLNKIRNWIWFL